MSWGVTSALGVTFRELDGGAGASGTTVTQSIPE